MPDNDSESRNLAQRLQSIRQSIERKKTAAKAKERAKARSERRGAKARERAEKERRIEQRNPESVGETVKASKEEASQIASEARELVSTELGIRKEDADDTIEKLNNIKDEFGGVLDVDGDGDTDLLQLADQPADMDATEPVIEQGPTEPVNQSGEEFDPVDPVGGDVTEPLDALDENS